MPYSLLYPVTLALVACVASLAHAQQPETLVFDQPQTAGMSMFRTEWDTPIPLAEGGVTTFPENLKDPSRGAYAVWPADKRQGRPGAIAFDALNRSLLVRFPDAAEAIAARLKEGGRISKVELVLPFKDEELFPPGGPDFRGTSGYEYRMNWGVDELYAKERPTWHAIAWALRKPWVSDEASGPTFNAAINGALYWKKYGAQDEKEDRVPMRFGPAEVSYKKSESLDVTASLVDPAFGATLGERLRRLADCGFLVKKWETYDHRFYRGVYEWATSTGGRAILVNTPKLVVTFAPDKAKSVDLPEAVDVLELGKTLKGTAQGGVPTAVIPSAEEIQKLAEASSQKPAWMDETQWKHLQELKAMKTGKVDEREPDWVLFVRSFQLDNLRGLKWENGKKTYSSYAKPEDVYVAWVDKLLRRQPRGWAGFDTAEQFTEWDAAKGALPEPALDAVRRYWEASLMADRPTAPRSSLLDVNHLDGSLVHPMADQLLKGSNTSAEIQGDSYWLKTGDWRGNKSFFRSGFCYAQSTQNFNTTASTGAFIFGGLFGAENALADGKHGVNNWLLNGWIGGDGTSQEHYDHYYYTVTLKGLKALQNCEIDLPSTMLGDALVTKTVAEALLAWHPNLRRFIAPSSRTSLEYLLARQDGGQFLMHVLSKKGALTDVGQETLPGRLPVLGHETPPTLIALMSLPKPWVTDDMAVLSDEKPLPWEAIHRNGGQWRRTYLGENYGLSSAMTQSGRIQAMAQWRREAKQVTSARDLGTLDLRMGINETGWINTAPGWIAQPGNLIVAQNKNTWLALGSPQNFNGGFGDGKTPVTSVQSSIGLFDIRALEPGVAMPWEIYVNGTKIEQLPVNAKQGDHITIRDGVTYLSVIALPSPDLGRDAEVTLEEGKMANCKVNGDMDFRPGLVINSYIVKKAEPLAKDADWEGLNKAYAGFAVQFGDEAEYRSFAAFQKKMAASRVKVAFNPESNTVTADYNNGEQTLEVKAVTAPEGKNADGTWKEFPTKLVEATLDGAPLYPDENLLLDTPVEQYRWNQAEKNGATLATSVVTGQGARMYLQSSTDKRRFVGWNLQGTPADLQLTLPDGAKLRSDGLLGLARIGADLDKKTLDVKHAFVDGRKAGGGTNATALLLTGFEGYKITLNGKPSAERLESVSIGGSDYQVLPLEEEVPPRTAEAIEPLLNIMDEALPVIKSVEPNRMFMHFHIAGLFPNKEGVYGPEVDPKNIDLQATYAGAGQDGKDVAWRPANKIHLGLPVLGDAEGTSAMRHALFFYISPKNPTPPGAYYLHATVRSGKAQQVGVVFRLVGENAMPPSEVKIWVNGQPSSFELSRGLVAVPLEAGENTILLKIRQDERARSGGERLKLTLGDPIFGVPNLTDVDWKALDGSWVPVNPKK